MCHFNGTRILLLIVVSLTMTAPINHWNSITSLSQPSVTSLEKPSGQLLFTGRANGQKNIYLVDVDSTEVRALTTMYDAGSPSVSPDNEHVAFTAIDDSGWNIYVVDIDGSNPHPLTTKGGLFPAWSPDGNSIAFISTRDSRPRLYVMNANGSNQRRLADLDIFLGLHPAPAWSPDSQRIAVVSTLSDIYVVDPDDSQLSLISRTASFGPDWSPDGTKIAFSESGQGTQLQIHITNPDGSEPQDLSMGHIVEDMLNPVWSPDGQYIAFTSRGWQTESIYVMDADGSNKHLLVDAESPPGPPIWSPDGQYIAFPMTCDGSEQIYIAHLDGSTGDCLTTGGVRVNGDLVWMP